MEYGGAQAVMYCPFFYLKDTKNLPIFDRDLSGSIFYFEKAYKIISLKGCHGNVPCGRPSEKTLPAGASSAQGPCLASKALQSLVCHGKELDYKIHRKSTKSAKDHMFIMDVYHD